MSTHNQTTQDPVVLSPSRFKVNPEVARGTITRTKSRLAATAPAPIEQAPPEAAKPPVP